MTEIEDMNKEQVEAALDEVMDTREDLLYQLIDLQMQIGDLLERQEQIE